MTKIPANPQQDRALGLGVIPQGGRFVTSYDPDLALQIVEMVAEGRTLTKILAEESGMPHRSTFNRWVLKYPDLAKAWRAAREMSAASLEEEALDVGRNIFLKPGLPQQVSAANALMGQLRWSASRRNPAEYGDKAIVNIRVPVTIETSLNIGQKGPPATGGEAADVYDLTATVLQQPDVEVPSEPEKLRVTHQPADLPLTLPKGYDHEDFIARPTLREPRKRVLTPKVSMNTQLTPKWKKKELSRASKSTISERNDGGVHQAGSNEGAAEEKSDG